MYLLVLVQAGTKPSFCYALLAPSMVAYAIRILSCACATYSVGRCLLLQSEQIYISSDSTSPQYKTGWATQKSLEHFPLLNVENNFTNQLKEWPWLSQHYFIHISYFFAAA